MYSLQKISRQCFTKCIKSKLLRQTKSKDPCAVNSRVNFRYLDTPEKLEKMTNLSRLVRVNDKQVVDLKKKFDTVVEGSTIRVDDAIFAVDNEI